ncbi:fungal-specific transcription factor domain-domain-containing protein [Protomyces lactucae-debilis]|uniref:Fungal-specific transcription factor domain-domain-containing protein n=1 Tax=Protomyces lactucae-debilis TaxID=2754530 RepID=A0A1Y2F7M2_PROLT|nr:fungal-specific transcription factor domain-containing protein [Protomyces lactucae-debilis]ORY79871.1 fungal-specific transcription factor domain-domain-containing protein [Protomyces lactucae-debilis]
MTLYPPADLRLSIEDDTEECPGEQYDQHDDDHTSGSMAEGKRRRITKACDRCRLKKVRFDGETPCSNCLLYSKMCHFTTVVKKRAISRTVKYTQDLETRLGKMEILLKRFLPDFEMTDEAIDEAIQKRALTRASLQSPRSSGCDKDVSDEDVSCSHIRSSQISDDELAQKMGHLWHDNESEYEDAQYSGAASSYAPLVDVRKTTHNLTGNDFFAKRFNGYRQRLNEQERIMWQKMDSLLDVSANKKVEQFLASVPGPRACKRYVDCYFSTFHAEFACIDQRHFMSSLDHTTWQPKKLQDMSFLSLYLLVLSFGLQLSKQGTLVNKNFLEGFEALVWFNLARSIIFNFREYGNFTYLQCTILFALYLERLGHRKELWILGDLLVRNAQLMGLHRRFEDPCMSSRTKEVRKRCWWIIYELDDRLTSVSGNPTAVNDLECDQELPALTEEEIADYHGVRFKDGQPFSCLVANIQLTQINHQIRRKLYSVDAIQHLSSEQVQQIVDEIDVQLLAFAENLPDEHRPGDSRETRQQPRHAEEHIRNFIDKDTAFKRSLVRECYLIPGLRLAYLQTVMLLHRRNAQPSDSTKSDQHDKSLPANPDFNLSERASSAYSSRSITMQAARAIIYELCNRVPFIMTTLTNAHILLARFAQPASLVIFNDIIRHPSSSSALADLDLLSSIHTAFVEHHARFPPAEDDNIPRQMQSGLMTRIMPEALGELYGVAALMIKQAELSRSADRPGTVSCNDPPLFADLQALLQSGQATDPRYFGQDGFDQMAAHLTWAPSLDHLAESDQPYRHDWSAFRTYGHAREGCDGQIFSDTTQLTNLATPYESSAGLAVSSFTGDDQSQQAITGHLQQHVQKPFAGNSQPQTMAGTLRDDNDVQNLWHTFYSYQQQ